MKRPARTHTDIEEMHLIDRDFFAFVRRLVEASLEPSSHKLRRTEPSPAKSAASGCGADGGGAGAACTGEGGGASGRGGMAWRSDDAEHTALAAMNLALRFVIIVRALTHGPGGAGGPWPACRPTARTVGWCPYRGMLHPMQQVYLRTVPSVRVDMAEWRGAFQALYEGTPLTVRYLLAVAASEQHPGEALPPFAVDEDCGPVSERFLETFLYRNELVGGGVSLLSFECTDLFPRRVTAWEAPLAWSTAAFLVQGQGLSDSTVLQEDVRAWVGQWLTDALEFAVRNDGGDEVMAATGHETVEVRLLVPAAAGCAARSKGVKRPHFVPEPCRARARTRWSG